MQQTNETNTAPPITGQSYRWVMLGLIWLIYAVFGMISASVAPLVTSIKGDLDVSFTEMGIVLGAWQLMYIATAPIAGTLIDKIGLRRALGIGVLLIVVSAFLRAFAGGFPTLFLAVAMFGVGGPTISIGSPKMVSMWFGSKERGLATGIYSTAPILGTVTILAGANSIFVPLTGGWRETFMALGVLAFFTAVAWWVLSREPDTTSAQASAAARQFAGMAQSPWGVISEIVRERNVQMILVLAIGTFAVSHGLFTWLPSLLQSNGMAPDEAGFWAAVPSLVGIVGLLTLPRIIVAGHRAKATSVLLVMWGISLVLLSQTTGVPLFFGLAMMGFVNSCIMPALMLILMETPIVGPQRMGMAAGLYFSVAEIGGFGGPFLLGRVYDASGSLVGGVMFLAVVALVLAVPPLLIKERREQQPTLVASQS